MIHNSGNGFKNKIFHKLAELDATCDALSGIGTLSNLVDIALKIFLQLLVSSQTIEKNEWLSRLHHKPFKKCGMGLFPLYGSRILGRENACCANYFFVLEHVRHDGLFLRFSSWELRSDPTVARITLRQNSQAIRFVAPALQNHADFILSVLRENFRLIERIPYARFVELTRNSPPSQEALKTIFLNALREDGDRLRFGNEGIRRDHEMALAALQQTLLARRFVHPSLLRDPIFIQEILSRNLAYIEFVDIGKLTLLDSPIDVCCEGLQHNGLLLHLLPIELRQNERVALTAFRQNIAAMQYVDRSLLDHPKFILEALKIDFSCYASFQSSIFKPERFAGSWEEVQSLALEAVKKKQVEFCVLPLEVRQNREIALAAIAQDVTNMPFVHRSVLEDSQFVLQALKKNFACVQFLQNALLTPERFAGSWEEVQSLALEAVKKKQVEFCVLPLEVRQNKDFALAAIAHDAANILSVDSSLRHNSQFGLEALRENSDCINHFDDGFFRPQNFPENVEGLKCLFLAAVRENGLRLVLSKEGFDQDEEVCLAAIAQNAEAIKYVDKSLLGNLAFINRVLRINFACAKFLKPKFLSIAIHADMNPLEKKLRSELRAIFLSEILRDGMQLSGGGPDIRNDDEMIYSAIRQNPEAVTYIYPTLLYSAEFVIRILEANISCSLFLEPQKLKDLPCTDRIKNLFLQGVEKKGSLLQLLPNWAQEDEDIVLKAIRKDHTDYRFVTTKFSSSTKFILKALEANFSCYQFVPADILNRNFDAEFNRLFLSQVQKDGLLLKLLPAWARQDEDITIAALQQNAQAREFVHPSLFQRRSFIIKALKAKLMTLEGLDPYIRGDENVVRAAVEADPRAFLLAAVRAQTEERAIEILRERHPHFYSDPQFPEHLRINRTVTQWALEYDADAYCVVPANLVNNEDLYRHVLDRAPHMFTYFPMVMRSNPRLAEHAIRLYYLNFRHLPLPPPAERNLGEIARVISWLNSFKNRFESQVRGLRTLADQPRPITFTCH